MKTIIKENIIVLIILLLIGIIYLWISTAGTYSFGGESYYGYLADAFLAGKTSLLIKPIQPYLQDLSVYNGKYYLYWGAVPAILFNITARIIFHEKMPDALSVLLFMFGTLLWSAAILNYLRYKFFSSSNFYIYLLSIIAIGFGNLGLYLLGFASGWPLSVYVVSVSAGVFFMVGSLYWLFKGFFEESNKYIFLFIGGTFISLAPGCRINMIVPVIFILLLSFFYFFLKYYGKNRKTFFKSVLSLLLPVVVSFILIGIYNYVRFGNILESGLGYLPNNEIYLNFTKNIKEYSLFKFYILLYSPPRFRHVFPFLFIRNFLTYEPKFFNIKLMGIWNEVSGLQYVSPFVWVIPVALIFSVYLKFKKYRNSRLFNLLKSNQLIIVFIILASTSIIIIGSHFLTYGIEIRYFAEYATFVLIFSSVVWFWLDNKLSDYKKTKFFVRIIMIFFTIFTIYSGLALGINGFYAIGGNLRQGNPDLFNYLNHLFK